MKETYVTLCALAMGLSMAALAVTYLPEADESDPATEHAQCTTDTECHELELRGCSADKDQANCIHNDGGPQS